MNITANIRTAGKVLTMCALFFCMVCSAQDYPTKPLKIIYPYGAGGRDYLLRIIGQKLTERWGQPVIVETRPGGNTIIGTEAVAKSAPDGYTILVHTDQFLLTPLLQKAPYNPIRDFEAVAVIGLIAQPLLVPTSVPATSLKDLMALAKSQPGMLTYASLGGAGSSQHINMELFGKAAGLNIRMIPYTGAVQAITALLGDQITMGFLPPSQVSQHIKAGKLRPVAYLISPAEPIAGIPDMPSMTQVVSEAGFGKFEPFGPWLAAFVPAGTPKEVVRKLNEGLQSVLRSPEIVEALRTDGMWKLPRNTPEDAADFIRSELAVRERAIKLSGVQLQ